jgi:hypothetical protein
VSTTLRSRVEIAEGRTLLTKLLQDILVRSFLFLNCFDSRAQLFELDRS